MMRPVVLGIALAPAALLLAGCRFERTGHAHPASDIQQSYDADGHAAKLLAQRVPSYLADKAVAFDDVPPAPADNDGREPAYTAAAAAKNVFVVQLRGRVIAEAGNSRSRSLEIDSNGDGRSDARVQVGTVIRGSALRDALPFVTFNDFDSQVDYAHFSRALNRRAVQEALAGIPDPPQGRTVEILGAFHRTPDTEPLVTPIRIRAVPTG